MSKNYGVNNDLGRPTIVELSAYWDVFDGKPQKFDDPEDMAKRCWLYLTNDGMPNIATIKKEAFLHEVTAMIEIAIAFAKKEPESIPLSGTTPLSDVNSVSSTEK